MSEIRPRLARFHPIQLPRTVVAKLLDSDTQTESNNGLSTPSEEFDQVLDNVIDKKIEIESWFGSKRNPDDFLVLMPRKILEYLPTIDESSFDSHFQYYEKEEAIKEGTSLKDKLGLLKEVSFMLIEEIDASFDLKIYKNFKDKLLADEEVGYALGSLRDSLDLIRDSYQRKLASKGYNIVTTQIDQESMLNGELKFQKLKESFAFFDKERDKARKAARIAAIAALEAGNKPVALEPDKAYFVPPTRALSLTRAATPIAAPFSVRGEQNYIGEDIFRMQRTRSDKRFRFSKIFKASDFSDYDTNKPGNLKEKVKILRDAFLGVKDLYYLENTKQEKIRLAHGDIKPSNILVRAEKNPTGEIIDCESCVPLSRKYKDSNSIDGTPQYNLCTYFGFDLTNERSYAQGDVFSAGLTLMSLFTDTSNLYRVWTDKKRTLLKGNELFGLIHSFGSFALTSLYHNFNRLEDPILVDVLGKENLRYLKLDNQEKVYYRTKSGFYIALKKLAMSMIEEVRRGQSPTDFNKESFNEISQDICLVEKRSPRRLDDIERTNSRLEFEFQETKNVLWKSLQSMFICDHSSFLGLDQDIQTSFDKYINSKLQNNKIPAELRSLMTKMIKLSPKITMDEVVEELDAYLAKAN